MDPTDALPTRQRLVVAALAVAVTVLALLRPTPDVGAHTDGVNELPTGPSALAAGR